MIAKNPQRMGPLTLEARATALVQILDIQRRAGVDLINDEEEARIRELIAAGTFPDRWEGDEPRADAWLDAVYADGSEQPILFRELVGS
jgi:DNA sulfur modification protein DndC